MRAPRTTMPASVSRITWSAAIACTPFASPGCLVTSLTRSPRSQTSHSCSWRPLMYSAPVRAAMAKLLDSDSQSRLGRRGSPDGLQRELPLLELQILAGRGVRVALDQPGARDLDARGHAPDEALLEDRPHQRLIGDDLLDLMEQGLALLAVELVGLLLEEVVDLGQRAVRVKPALGEERLEPRRRVAGGAGRADEEPLQLLLVPRGHERGSLHRPHPGADPDALEIAAHRLGERGIGWKRCEVARIEAVGIARFRQELLGALGIERGRLDLQREVELRRHEPSRGLAIAQHLGLIDRVAVDDQAGRLADAAVVPG